MERERLRIWDNQRNEEKLCQFLRQHVYKKRAHGVKHGKIVEAFGMYLAHYYPECDRDVVRWFAYLHDSQCEVYNPDYNDDGHGQRAADYIDKIRLTYLSELNDMQIEKLKTACIMHTSTHKVDDVTVNVCFDSDRMDLPRVNIQVNPEKMATDAGANLAQRKYEECLVLVGCTPTARA